MPSFAYTALNADGREVKGSLDAPDLSDARRQLRARTLMPLSLELGAGTDKGAAEKRSPTRYLWVRQRDKQFLFRQLALMVQAGHRVRQSLETCAELVEREGLAQALRSMVNSIDRGLSFAEAMRAEGRRFPAFAPALIEAGEASGNLEKVLSEIAYTMDKAASLRSSLLRALLLPVITVFVGIAVVSVIVFWTVPKLAEFVGRSGGEIHWTLQILVDLAEFLYFYGPYIALGLAILAGATIFANTLDKGKITVGRIILSLPIFGPTMRYYEMSRLGTIGAMLLEAGLRQVEALKVMSNVAQNHAYKERYTKAADELLTGRPLSEALGAGIVPRLVSHMISVGETSGSIDRVLDRVGNFYAEAVETRVTVILSTLVPSIVIVIGIMVFFIYVSVFLTIIVAYNSIR